MHQDDIEKFRLTLVRLEQELSELSRRSRVSADTVELDQSSVGRLSRMDALQSQAMAQENRRRRELQRVRIQAALERIDEGEFGYCASCGEDINRRRLDVDPANPFCVECAAEL
jgi:DnaK suppressor protein